MNFTHACAAVIAAAARWPALFGALMMAFVAPMTAAQTSAAAQEQIVSFEFGPVGAAARPALSVDFDAGMNLYEAQVPVAGREGADRTAALQAAMRIVLQRLTGRGDLAGEAAAADIIQRAPQLVQQYRYATASGSVDGFGPVPAQLDLRVEFSASVVNQEIEQAGLALWQVERPVTVLWAIRQAAAGWELLPINSSVTAALQEQAANRGIKLVIPEGRLPENSEYLPINELDEQLLELTGGLLEQAGSTIADSARVSRVLLAGDDALRWRELNENNGGKTWRSGIQRGEQQAARAGLDMLVDSYAAELPVVANEIGLRVVLEVTAIGSLTQFVASQRYLRQLQQIIAVRFLQLNDNAVVFELQVRGDVELLQSALTLDDKLSPELEPGLESGLNSRATTVGMPLRYRWRG